MSKVIPVKVAVRIRPLSDKEEEEGCQSVLKVVPGRPQIYISSLEKAFTYDYAFDVGSTQSEVYDSAVAEMVGKLFEGYNATVLAYGQTGSGKTHSMGTAYKDGVTKRELAGIIPRAVAEIFEEIGRRESEVDVSVRVAFVELYREQLYDLLSPQSARKEDCICEVREDPSKGVYIPGLTENPVISVDSAMQQLESGSLKRVTAATAMNNTSSRSHAIFSVLLTIVGKGESPAAATVSKFHLVDLAGSERPKKTKATGDRYKEGVAINQGLLALGNVIAALGEENPSKNHHIPYRVSKLTRLLQDSLGGNSYTLMVSCVSPADSNTEETLSTLRYSDRARKIKNKPIINLDGNDAELNRLRAENHELRQRLVLEGNGGVSVARVELEAKDRAMVALKDENRTLSRALSAAQEELAHLNEKVMLHETANEKLKTKTKELMASLDAIIKKGPVSSDVEAFHDHVKEVINIQEKAEKTMVDHDATHVDQWNEAHGNGQENHDDEDDEDEVVAQHTQKRNALHTELHNLNNALAQKEKLASAMVHNEETLREMRKKYEGNLLELESELKTVQKEKDELMQQQKNHTSSNADTVAAKIAEQRRKRIQELETKLGELKKQLVDQQRALKVNERNEAQLKKLSEEIRELKQAKVRLIRQFKEDAEKLRAYKQQKEKEVAKLKQNERKQQAKMVKMENLHTKQQNVAKRKLEEAQTMNKRLKDLLEKQKANAKGFANGRGGMAGAGDRVRNWVNEEMNVVVSVREATQSKDLLLNDRKELTRKLSKMKEQMRDTMTAAEMKQHQVKMDDLKSELDLRNAQIAQLQKQISDLEANSDAVTSSSGSSAASAGGTNSGGGNGSRASRFDTLKTLTEAKIALEHLFDKSVEQQFMSTQLKSEFEELRSLYNEAVKNTNTLESEIASMKNEFETKIMRTKREHEENMLVLLNDFKSKQEDNEGGTTKEEIRWASKLNDELTKMSEENERLRKEMLGREISEKNKAAETQLKRQVSQNLNDKNKKQRYTAEEYFNEVDSEEEMEEDSFVDDQDRDPDWEKTPLFSRIKKLRETNMNNTTVLATGNVMTAAAGPGMKRKNATPPESSEDTDDDNNGSFNPPKVKRSSNSGAGNCKCKGKCDTKRCSCRKSGPACSESCGCDSTVCRNRGPDRSVLADISNATAASNDTANTMSLLNDTYPVVDKNDGSLPLDGEENSPSAELLKTVRKTPQKPTLPEQRRTYFVSPLAGDDSSSSPVKRQFQT